MVDWEGKSLKILALAGQILIRIPMWRFTCNKLVPSLILYVALFHQLSSCENTKELEVLQKGDGVNFTCWIHNSQGNNFISIPPGYKGISREKVHIEFWGLTTFQKGPSSKDEAFHPQLSWPLHKRWFQAHQPWSTRCTQWPRHPAVPDAISRCH